MSELANYVLGVAVRAIREGTQPDEGLATMVELALGEVRSESDGAATVRGLDNAPDLSDGALDSMQSLRGLYRLRERREAIPRNAVFVNVTDGVTVVGDEDPVSAALDAIEKDPPFERGPAANEAEKPEAAPKKPEPAKTVQQIRSTRLLPAFDVAGWKYTRAEAFYILEALVKGTPKNTVARRHDVQRHAVQIIEAHFEPTILAMQKLHAMDLDEALGRLKAHWEIA